MKASARVVPALAPAVPVAATDVLTCSAHTQAKAQVWAEQVSTSVAATGTAGANAGTTLADAFMLIPPVVQQTDSELQNMAFALRNVGTAGEEAAAEVVAGAEAIGGSMREARGGIALMGEEIGVKVPRHLQTFLAGLPGVQTAMSLAFAPLAI